MSSQEQTKQPSIPRQPASPSCPATQMPTQIKNDPRTPNVGGSSGTNNNAGVQNGDNKTYIDGEKAWIFHRDRKQPTPDINEPAINKIKFYLDRYNIKAALQIFSDKNTLKLLGSEPDFMWDLISLICKRLRGLCQYRFRVFEGCAGMLTRIAVDENCNPKEVLISLLAEISQKEHADDDNLFRALIRPLERTLLRMNYPSPRCENLKWVLSVLSNHLNSIELPQEYNLEGNKRLALPNDPSVKRYIELLPLMFSFIEKFNDRPHLNHYDKSPMPILTESQIEEVFNGELVDDDDVDLISDLQNPCRSDNNLEVSVTALLAIMYKPLTFLDLSVYCMDLRLDGNRCLNSLLDLRPNLFSPIYKRICQKSTSNSTNNLIDTSTSNLSNTSSGSNNMAGLCNESIICLATCAYIYKAAKEYPFDTFQCFPQVITSEYSLFCHVPFIVALLDRAEILVNEKGLLLLDNLISQLYENSLDEKYLELFETSTLLRQLFKMMVFSPYCENRRKAYETFTNICDLLTYDCKLKVFKNVLSQTDLRPCVRAACIDQYRKHLTNIYRELMNLHQQLTALTQSFGAGTTPTDLPQLECLKYNAKTITTTVELTTPDASMTGTIETGSEVDDSNATETNDNKGMKKIVKSSCSIKKEVAMRDLDISVSKLIDRKYSSSTEKLNSILEMNTAIVQRIKQLHIRYKALGGTVLVEFLDLCIEACLPDLQHTDIIENYELLLATLTILRFLKLRQAIFKDSIEDEYLSGGHLKKAFFDPIRNAIALIMSELKLHHKEIVEGHKEKNTKITQKSIMNVSQSRNEFDLLSRILGNNKLDEIIDSTKDNALASLATPDALQQLEELDETDCLNWALCRLDLVESVLVRTCDLYNC